LRFAVEISRGSEIKKAFTEHIVPVSAAFRLRFQDLHDLIHVISHKRLIAARSILREYGIYFAFSLPVNMGSTAAFAHFRKFRDTLYKCACWDGTVYVRRILRF